MTGCPVVGVRVCTRPEACECVHVCVPCRAPPSPPFSRRVMHLE